MQQLKIPLDKSQELQTTTQESRFCGVDHKNKILCPIVHTFPLYHIDVNI
jgi:hypothetical protein